MLWVVIQGQNNYSKDAKIKLLKAENPSFSLAFWDYLRFLIYLFKIEKQSSMLSNKQKLLNRT